MARRKHEAIPWETVAKIHRRLLGAHALDRLALELHGIDVSTGRQVAMTPQSARTSSAFAWACLEYLRSGYSGDALRANAKALEDAIKVLEADGGEALAIYMAGAADGVIAMTLAQRAVWSMRDLAKSLHRQAQRIEAADAGASFGTLLARRLQGQKISVGMARKVYDAMTDAAHKEGFKLHALEDDGALRRALGRGAKVEK